jgi:hypothetical protein
MNGARSSIGGWRVLTILVILLLLALTPAAGASQPSEANPFHFRIKLSPQAAAGIAALGLEVPVNGRAYIILTRNGNSEPRNQISVTGVPFWGVDVQGLGGGATVFMGTGLANEVGYPLERFSDIPEGDYYVQAFLNVYTTFNRSDGNVLRMHKDTGSGQNIWRAPGNAYSKVAQVHLGGGSSRRVDLDITEVIPPIDPVPAGGVLEQGNPPNRSPYVEFFKIKSDVVSQFWGQDMYVGANVLLPEGYTDPANANVAYPVIYLQGHFPGSGAPFGFTPTNAFGQWWRSAEAPRFIAVTFRHASPYYDDSYAVNSANHGPYGDALVRELIPALESRYRAIPQPWARVLTGGSTGGWESVALKVWFPESFGHTWSWCPDPVDFNYYQIVDIYDDPNAYYVMREWIKVEQPSARDIDGDPRFTVKQENDWERAIGPNTRSTGQWAAWEATWSPVGPDGYPARIWEPVSGKIDRSVAEYWKLNWDVNYRLQNNWATLGPLLQGQLHFATGDADTYFLNEAVHLLEASMAKMTNPPAGFTFEYGNRQPHCWRGASPVDPTRQISYPEWIQVVAETIGVSTSSRGAFERQDPSFAAQPEEVELEADYRAQ